MTALAAFVIALIAVSACTGLHYEVISRLDLALAARTGSTRRHLPLIITAVMAAHLIEIAIYAAAFWLVSAKLEVGSFAGGDPVGAAQFFALAAESYTSFGYGDIVPTGWLRFIVSLAPINGLLLLAWSGAFLYGAVQQRAVTTDAGDNR